jgi:hypothetical protein
VSNFDSQKEGAYTERSYIKICSTQLAALKDWLKANGRADGTSTGNCPCKPDL